jgi:hypothetical protein
MSAFIRFIGYVSFICLAAIWGASLHAQQGIPSQACNVPATATASAAGNVSVINNSGDQTIFLCSITAQVTQGSTPANYQLQACTNSTCSTAYPVTPVLPGHANLYDTYNLPPNPTAQIKLRKGYGLYLTLSGTATAVVQAIYGVY